VAVKKSATVTARRTKASKSPGAERGVEVSIEDEMALAADVDMQSSETIEPSLSIGKDSVLSCRHCGKTFSRHWDWNRHEKTHLPDNEYVFFSCSRILIFFSNYMFRVCRKPFQCWCGHGAVQRSNFLSHLDAKYAPSRLV
jgi:hypothetical protein